MLATFQSVETMPLHRDILNKEVRGVNILVIISLGNLAHVVLVLDLY